MPLSSSASAPALRIVTHKSSTQNDNFRYRDDDYVSTRPIPVAVVNNRAKPRRPRKKRTLVPPVVKAAPPVVVVKKLEEPRRDEPRDEPRREPEEEEMPAMDIPVLTEAKKRDYGYGVPQWSPYFVPPTVHLTPHEPVSGDYGIFSKQGSGALDPVLQCRVSPLIILFELPLGQPHEHP